MAPVPTCYFRGRRGEKLLCGETLGNQESHIQEVSADQHRIEEKCNTTVGETKAESYWYTDHGTLVQKQLSTPASLKKMNDH